MIPMRVLFLFLNLPDLEKDANLYGDLAVEFALRGHEVFVATLLEARRKTKTHEELTEGSPDPARPERRPVQCRVRQEGSVPALPSKGTSRERSGGTGGTCASTSSSIRRPRSRSSRVIDWLRRNVPMPDLSGPARYLSTKRRRCRRPQEGTDPRPFPEHGEAALCRFRPDRVHVPEKCRVRPRPQRVSAPEKVGLLPNWRRIRGPSSFEGRDFRR